MSSRARFRYYRSWRPFCTGKREAKVGMWKNGTSLETPGLYKKRKKEGFIPDEVTDDVTETGEGESWFTRLKNILRRR